MQRWTNGGRMQGIQKTRIETTERSNVVVTARMAPHAIRPPIYVVEADRARHLLDPDTCPGHLRDLVLDQKLEKKGTREGDTFRVVPVFHLIASSIRTGKESWTGMSDCDVCNIMHVDT
jgi:hypothetical protein